jgi:hypothetical protein
MGTSRSELAMNTGLMRSIRLKRIPTLLACAWLAVPLLAHADTPSVNPQALGIVESIANYCGRLDPARAVKLQEQVKQLAQGVSEQQLAEVRKSSEYREGYDSVVDFVAKADEHNAKRICSETPVEHK